MPVVDAQHKAVHRLLAKYGLSGVKSGEGFNDAVASLMADALTFDLKHPRNGGVEVVKVLARHLQFRFPNLAREFDKPVENSARAD